MSKENSLWIVLDLDRGKRDDGTLIL